MTDDFQQTVDLRDKMKKERDLKRNSEIKKTLTKERESLRPSPLKEVKKIIPPETDTKEIKFKFLLLIIALAIGILFIYLFILRDADNNSQVNKKNNSSKWYSIKLLDGEIFYGQVEDVSADPIIVEKVYYNYEQIKDENKEVDESGNLRLVKRGKETHGPTGTMNIVRSQVIYMEPLQENSKVLKAILEYEN